MWRRPPRRRRPGCSRGCVGSWQTCRATWAWSSPWRCCGRDVIWKQASGLLEAIDKGLATGKVEGKRQWYLTRQGQTMVVVPKPAEFWMGEGDERHRRRIE